MESINLTKKQLLGLINFLKESLTIFDRQYKVAYFNDWSFYHHVRNFYVTCEGVRKGATIGAILDILEPYIPFKLSEENFELFMESVLKHHNITPEFSHKAKLDFVLALRTIRHPEELNQTLAVCESIRALKEEMTMVHA